MIDRQREFTIENKELRERLIMNKLQISELKAAKASLEEDIDSLQEQLQQTQKSLASQFEIGQVRIEQQVSKNKALFEENQQLHKQLQQLQTDNLMLQGKTASLNDQISELQAKFQLVSKEKSIIETGKLLLEQRIEEIAKDRELDFQNIRLLTRRVEIANENLQTARKEMISKDDYIRTLQSQTKISELNLATPSQSILCTVVPPETKKKNKKKQHDHVVHHKLVDTLNSELKEVREALSAHQAHSAFLEADVSDTIVMFPAKSYISQGTLYLVVKDPARKEHGTRH